MALGPGPVLFRIIFRAKKMGVLDWFLEADGAERIEG